MACFCFFMHCKHRFIKERGERAQSGRNADTAFFSLLRNISMLREFHTFRGHAS